VATSPIDHRLPVVFFLARHSGAGRNPVTTAFDSRERADRPYRENPALRLLDSGLRRNDGDGCSRGDWPLRFALGCAASYT